MIFSEVLESILPEKRCNCLVIVMISSYFYRSELLNF